MNALAAASKYRHFCFIDGEWVRKKNMYLYIYVCVGGGVYVCMYVCIFVYACQTINRIQNKFWFM